MAAEKSDSPLKAVIFRLASALWPILFIPPAILLVRSGLLGPYQHVAEDITEPLTTVTVIYASIYIVLWIVGLQHTTAAVFSIILSIIGIIIWQAIAPTIT